MAAITVRVGREEKEISGLTRRTTCSDVLQALLKDRQLESNVGAKNGDDVDLVVTDLKSLKELAKNYVIIENWRGCERPLPPQTRILAIWYAWGKEQCHVKFSVKKDKNRYRDNSPHVSIKDESPSQYKNFINMMNNNEQQNNQAENSHYTHNITHEQKRRILRSMMQYHRAVLIQHSKETTDDNNNAGKPYKSSNCGERTSAGAGERNSSSRQKSTETTKVTFTLSEEQFVDGVITGPDCLLHHDGKSKFIRSVLDNKEFNREHCTYRRPHHRRRSLMLEDSDGPSDQNAVLSLPKRQVNHYPYCRKSRRRSSRRRRHRSKTHGRHGRVSKSSKRHNKSQGGRYSTDDTTTTTTSTGTASDASDLELDSHSPGEDADDEKSVMAEFGSVIARQKVVGFSGSMLQYCNAAAASRAPPATDSSSATTTCSETSNTSSSSFSSETSSGTDYFGESYFAKKAAAAAAAAANAKANEKSKSGSSSGPAKLFRKVKGPSLTKPAQSLIGSFKKKRRAPQPPTSQASKSTDNENCTTNNKSSSKRAVTFLPAPSCGKEKQASKETKTSEDKLIDEPLATASTISNESKSTDSGISLQDNRCSPKTVFNESRKATDDAENQKSFEQLKQLILSQEQILSSKCKKVTSTDDEIERIEAQVHAWRTQAHGKNYVQDTYLSGMGDPSKGANGSSENGCQKSLSSTMRAPQWLSECQDVQMLSEFVDRCTEIVETQMRIEECKRRFEIVLQDMQDEVWKASSDPSAVGSNPLTASALGLISGDGDADSSDDEAGSRLESLSISKPKNKVPASPSPKESAQGTLELERSRTELEANLYLSLRLSTELDEVEQRTTASQRLVQTKGEALLTLVRDLAQSEEGIPSELWEEYGDLLVAYDNELALKHHLAASTNPDIATGSMSCGETNSSIVVESKPDISLMNELNEIDPNSPTTSALHHALSPWLWCDHCKHELEQQQRGHMLHIDTPPMSPHWHSAIPPTFSDLPLPSPAVVREPPASPTRPGSSMTTLLPMPPIPDCNDSDYEDLPDMTKTNESNTTSTMISTEDAVPVVLRHPSGRSQVHASSNPHQVKDYLSVQRSNSASTTDDSGNASAASTSSFASTNSDSASTDMGSRNGSCDGGSPRPPSFNIESQDSAKFSPFFVRDSAKRSSWKPKFVFPPQDLKPFSKTSAKSPTKTNQPKSRPNFPIKPSVPIKPGTIASAPASPADLKRQTPPILADNDRLAQQQKLFRRNSGRRRSPLLQNNVFEPSQQNDQFGKRGSSFGKGGIRVNSVPANLSGMMKQPIVHNSHCDLAHRKSESDDMTTVMLNNLKNKHFRNVPSPLNLPTVGVAPPNIRSPVSAPCSPFVGHGKLNMRDQRRPNIQSVTGDKKKNNPFTTDNINNYDNDSDTGLSSLHSADSTDMLMYSETLV
ncbi:uncharacterized protein LOC143448912 [Clavelina lepadiformis]|uniref:uncharacterized protein LOC143448912 n=1 Tax=Clavelina lepadiformis TaxID=159417 RepID=UPI004041300E